MEGQFRGEELVYDLVFFSDMGFQSSKTVITLPWFPFISLVFCRSPAFLFGLMDFNP